MDQQEWILSQNFNVLGPLLGVLACGSLNCGSAERKNDHPYLQLAKNFLLDLFSLNQRYTRGIYLPVTEGYQELWKRISKDLHIIFSVKVEKIWRSSDQKIKIQTSERSFEFDELIVACQPNRLLDVLDYTPKERDIFQKVHFSPGWTFALLAKNIPGQNVFVISESINTIQHSPLYGFAARERLEDGNWLCQGIIGHPHPDGIKQIQTEVEEIFKDHFGAKDIHWLDKVYWPEYNAHFQCEDAASGIYDRLEALQGDRYTYYTGELLSGGANGLVVDYSYDLIRRFF